MTDPTDQPARAAGGDKFIPVRKSDILDALGAIGLPGGPAENGKFATFCRMLAAIYHYTYFERLEALRADYYYFNPQIEPHKRCDPAVLERAYEQLRRSLDEVLTAANFEEIPHDEIERSHQVDALIRVKTVAPTSDFREIRFFRRGQRRQTFTIAEWFGLRRRAIECDVYDDVVVYVAMKPGWESLPERDRERLAKQQLRPGSVLIKYFRGVASADLNALFPNVRVIMGTLDKLILGIPAIAGGVPIVLNLVPALTILFLVIGFYLGLTGTIGENDTRKALAAISALAALGGFLLQQWIRYQRQSLKYQKLLSDNVYFRNVNNNAGIFDYLIGMAEEQECKEAFLAYHFLHAAGRPLAQRDIDARIESWLHGTFGIKVDFEVGDALQKLERLGLLRRSGEGISVLPLDETIARLDEVWDAFFARPQADRASAT